MRLFFDLTGYDDAHQEVWHRRLAQIARAGATDVALVDDPDDADYILETTGRQSFLGGRVFTVSPDSHYHQRPETTFGWDTGDFPTGRLPGLYCSLDRALFDPRRHRGFCYPLRYNSHIEAFSLEEADRLFGFCGSPSSALRYRLFAELAPFAADQTALLQKTTGVWTNLFGTPDAEAWKFYADILRRSRFFLCPRGNGLSSIRLFETMEAARVPVILSDGLVLPVCVDWSRCAIIHPENDLPGLAAHLRARESEWPQLARNARAEWEKNFGDAHLLCTVARELRAIVAARVEPEGGRRFPGLPGVARRYAWTRFKSVVRFGQRTLRRGAATA